VKGNKRVKIEEVKIILKNCRVGIIENTFFYNREIKNVESFSSKFG